LVARHNHIYAQKDGTNTSTNCSLTKVGKILFSDHRQAVRLTTKGDENMSFPCEIIFM